MWQVWRSNIGEKYWDWYHWWEACFQVCSCADHPTCTFCWVLWLCAWIFTTSRVKNACHSTEFFSEGYGALVLIPIVLFAEFWHQLKWRTTSLKSSKFARLFLPINCSDVKWMYFFALCKEDGKSNFFAITVAHNTRTVLCMCKESCWPQRGKENILKLLVTSDIKSSHK